MMFEKVIAILKSSGLTENLKVTFKDSVNIIEF